MEANPVSILNDRENISMGRKIEATKEELQNYLDSGLSTKEVADRLDYGAIFINIS